MSNILALIAAFEGSVAVASIASGTRDSVTSWKWLILCDWKLDAVGRCCCVKAIVSVYLQHDTDVSLSTSGLQADVQTRKLRQNGPNCTVVGLWKWLILRDRKLDAVGRCCCVKAIISVYLQHDTDVSLYTSGLQVDVQTRKLRQNGPNCMVVGLWKWLILRDRKSDAVDRCCCVKATVLAYLQHDTDISLSTSGLQADVQTHELLYIEKAALVL